MLRKLFEPAYGPRKAAAIRPDDGGMTRPMIGKLLGHTRVQTTQRYAHLLDNPFGQGLNRSAIYCGRSRGWFRPKRWPELPP